MLSNKKLGRLLLSEKYWSFNFWSLFLPCPTNKEPGCKSSSTIAVIGMSIAVIGMSLQKETLWVPILPGLFPPSLLFSTVSVSGVSLNRPLKEERLLLLSERNGEPSPPGGDTGPG